MRRSCASSFGSRSHPVPPLEPVRPGLGMPPLGSHGACPAGAGDAAFGVVRAEEAATVKAAFDVKIENYEAAVKIKIINEVRTVTDLGLKEAKELVEKAPLMVREGLPKEDVRIKYPGITGSSI
jgi:hypothetical protein